MIIDKESSQCEFFLDSRQLEQLKEFMYLGDLICENGTDDAEYNRIVESSRKVADINKFFVNAGGVKFCVKKGPYQH